jgi:acetyl esterase/lipase
MTFLTRFAAMGLALALSCAAAAQPTKPASRDDQPYTETHNVIYGHRDGVATTLDVIVPKQKPNGAGVVIFVSAGYRSGTELLKIFHPLTSEPFLQRGYVVFQVLHGSQPQNTVPSIVEDAHRAMRFIKVHARNYGVDPARIGVAGASSGGHLSLMMGCAGKPGNRFAIDPVERESSQAAAVACYFPPSNFPEMADKLPKEVAAAFDIREMNATSGLLERVSPEKRLAIGRVVSPITYVTKEAAPTLIIHGDKDEVVPLAQSEAMIQKLKDCGVQCKLIVKKGKAHFELGWVVPELPTLADWFDAHLLGKK